jgi:hypothetical protein
MRQWILARLVAEYGEEGLQNEGNGEEQERGSVPPPDRQAGVSGVVGLW